MSASAHGLAKNIILNDLNKPLMKLWEEILERPDDLVNLYEYLWNEQHIDKKKYFFKIREIFNS
ncbi:MAG: DNA adenine methylase, partial [Thiotrichaceae bacterium]|nr:DNA adenine methylase [Thiotrichaceae bacterium]